MPDCPNCGRPYDGEDHPGDPCDVCGAQTDGRAEHPPAGTPFTTYTQLRDFLDSYTSPDGVIQGDPATIAAEAVAAGHVEADANHAVQFED